ncbi:MAG: outer membrane beta-barrel protein [Xanthobacteraceae bacterium]|nr:outer membrane beta-barrel protein [Xanthobacteraceae bacterium]
MVSVKVASFVAAVALFASAAQTVQRAHAADLPQLPPVYAPPIEEYVAAGWYLRGDIGMSNQRVKSLDNLLFTSAVTVVQKDFDSAPLFGLGFGYQFNHWFRADVTGEYRGKANFHGLDIVQNGGVTRTNEYRGSKSEWLVLANVYADLGTWYGFTPFVGAGIGAAQVTISNFLDVNTMQPAVAYADTASKWNFAWAVHAGVSYKVNSQLSLEFAYRYVNLGDGISGDIIRSDGVNEFNNPMNFNKITSHDLKLGVRWLLDAPVERGPVLLPPLRSRG